MGCTITVMFVSLARMKEAFNMSIMQCDFSSYISLEIEIFQQQGFCMLYHTVYCYVIWEGFLPSFISLRIRNYSAATVLYVAITLNCNFPQISPPAYKLTHVKLMVFLTAVLNPHISPPAYKPTPSFYSLFFRKRMSFFLYFFVCSFYALLLHKHGIIQGGSSIQPPRTWMPLALDSSFQAFIESISHFFIIVYRILANVSGAWPTILPFFLSCFPSLSRNKSLMALMLCFMSSSIRHGNSSFTVYFLYS